MVGVWPFSHHVYLQTHPVSATSSNVHRRLPLEMAGLFFIMIIQCLQIVIFLEIVGFLLPNGCKPWFVTISIWIAKMDWASDDGPVRLHNIGPLSVYAGPTLSRNWPQMDTWLSRLHTLPKFGSDHKNIVKHREKILRYSWVHHKPSHEPGCVSPASASTSLRYRKIFAMPKNSWRSCQRAIFVGPSGINFGTVWCGLYKLPPQGRKWHGPKSISVPIGGHGRGP